MDMPSLPTDNLYKFSALAGIAVVILSLGFLFTRVSELKLKAVDTQVEIELLDLEVSNLNEDILSTNKAALNVTELSEQHKQAIKQALEVLNLEEDISSAKKAAPNATELSEKHKQAIRAVDANRVRVKGRADQLEVLVEQHKQNKQAIRASGANRVRVKGRADQLKVLVSEIWFAQWLIYLFALTGFLMSFIGFTFWYTRVQLPSDSILLKELQKNGSNHALHPTVGSGASRLPSVG